MTNQERPVEEQNELPGDQLNTTAVVDEPGSPVQESLAVEVQPEATEQPDALPIEPVSERVVAEVGDQATYTPEAAEQQAAQEDALLLNQEAPAAHADVSLSSESLEAALVQAATPAPEAAPSEGEGASYTPVAEEESGRPRRVKDLQPDMELEGRVTSIALYGVFVDIGVGRDGLVHISEMSDTRIESPSDIVQIGDTIKVRIKSVDPEGRRISLTMRSKERPADQRGRGRKKLEVDRERLASLKVGDTIEGTVTGIAPFGVFVDIGVGKDGLVHVSELAEGRIDKPEDAVQVGLTYAFKVLEVDAEGSRISLSLRRAQRSQRLQQLEPGQILEGTISGLAPFGAFVDIGVGRDGLIHISELSEKRVAKVEDVVKVGDKVQVRVLQIDPQSKRISLSMSLEERPREEPLETEAPAQVREDRGRREERGRSEERPPRSSKPRSAPAEAEADETFEEGEETFVGNATLEDLLSKYGSSKREHKRRAEYDDEDDDERHLRRQRDAIRRTLQQLSDDD